MTDYRKPHKFEPSGELEDANGAELCVCGLPRDIPSLHPFESEPVDNLKFIPIKAVYSLSDLAVWVDEIKPDTIYIPEYHPLRTIQEFNPGYWSTFRGIPIVYSFPKNA